MVEKTKLILYLGIAIVCWSFWAILNRLALQTLHPAAIQIISALTFAGMIPLYLYLLPRSEVKYQLSIGYLWSFLAAIATSTAAIAYMHVAGKGQVTQVLATTSLSQILTFILALLLLGETFTMNKFMGTCLIMAGVWMVNR